MHIPARILRAQAQSLRRTPIYLTTRQREREEDIVAVATALMAEHGSHAITLRTLALALQLDPSTLRWHFTDMHALLAHILRTHLLHLAAALGAVPKNAANRPQRQRAAYVAATRTPYGGLTPAHLLLVRDRHLLPDDELAAIQATHQQLGALVAGPLAEEALFLLNAHELNPALIEPTLIALGAPPPVPEPAPTPQTAPRTRAPPATRQRPAPPEDNEMAQLTDDELSKKGSASF